MTLPRITAGDRDDIVQGIKALLRRHPMGASMFGKFNRIARDELNREAMLAEKRTEQ